MTRLRRKLDAELREALAEFAAVFGSNECSWPAAGDLDCGPIDTLGRLFLAIGQPGTALNWLTDHLGEVTGCTGHPELSAVVNKLA